MKKMYQTPEFEVAELLIDDILTISQGNDYEDPVPEVGNETFMDGSGLFN